MMLLGFASAQICTNSAVWPAGTRGALLYMTLTTIPRRVHLIDRVVRSLVQQTRPPDKILLSLPRFYHRFPNETVDASRIQPHPLLSVTECERINRPTSPSGTSAMEKTQLIKLEQAKLKQATI